MPGFPLPRVSRARGRWLSIGAGVVVVGVAAGVAAAHGYAGRHHEGPHPRCHADTIRDLGEGRDVELSPDGRYLAGSEADGAVWLWHNGKTTRFHPKADGTSSVGAVGASGLVVGSYQPPTTTDDSPEIPWRHRGGDTTDLKRPERARQAYVSAVNDGGAAVGMGTIDNTHTLPVVWKPGSTKATVLPTGTEYGGAADDISDTGIVVGTRQRSATVAEAWMWDTDGRGERLPKASKTRGTEALAIAGNWVLILGDDGYYRWNLKSRGVPEKIDGGVKGGYDIDEHGLVYGDNGHEPVVADDEGTTRLPAAKGRRSKVPESANGSHRFVAAASRDGSRLAGVNDGHAVMWICR